MTIATLETVEDSGCDTDMNVVMTEAGHFIEAGCSGRRWGCKDSIAALRKGGALVDDVVLADAGDPISRAQRQRPAWSVKS